MYVTVWRVDTGGTDTIDCLAADSGTTQTVPCSTDPSGGIQSSAGPKCCAYEVLRYPCSAIRFHFNRGK